jgi:hypothetical protein
VAASGPHIELLLPSSFQQQQVGVRHDWGTCGHGVAGLCWGGNQGWMPFASRITKLSIISTWQLSQQHTTAQLRARPWGRFTQHAASAPSVRPPRLVVQDASAATNCAAHCLLVACGGHVAGM